MASSKEIGWIQKALLFAAAVDTDLLRSEGHASERAKLSGVGAAVWLTSLLAMLSGGYALNVAFESAPVTLAGALLWGVIIFNLDRLVVASMHGAGSLPRRIVCALPRLALAALIAVVVSKPIELAIVQSELDAAIAAREQALVETSARQARIDALRDEATNLRHEAKALEDQAYRELTEGDSGAKRPKGAGEVYELLTQQAVDRNSKLEQVLAETLTLETALAEFKASQDPSLYTIGAADGLLGRLRLLHQLAAGDPYIRVVDWFLMLLFVTLETAPTFLKILIGGGPYDAVVHRNNVTSRSRQAQRERFELLRDQLMADAEIRRLRELLEPPEKELEIDFKTEPRRETGVDPGVEGVEIKIQPDAVGTGASSTVSPSAELGPIVAVVPDDRPKPRGSNGAGHPLANTDPIAALALPILTDSGKWKTVEAIPTAVAAPERPEHVEQSGGNGETALSESVESAYDAETDEGHEIIDIGGDGEIPDSSGCRAVTAPDARHEDLELHEPPGIPAVVASNEQSGGFATDSAVKDRTSNGEDHCPTDGAEHAREASVAVLPEDVEEDGPNCTFAAANDAVAVDGAPDDHGPTIAQSVDPTAAPESPNTPDIEPSAATLGEEANDLSVRDGNGRASGSVVETGVIEPIPSPPGATLPFDTPPEPNGDPGRDVAKDDHSDAAGREVSAEGVPMNIVPPTPASAPHRGGSGGPGRPPMGVSDLCVALYGQVQCAEESADRAFSDR